jgi:FxLD family lantipeptide
MSSMTTSFATDRVDEPDFELDISIVESGPVIPELLRSTSDNCGGTCNSACTSCKS